MTSCASSPPRRLRQEKPGQTLQATALVHEAYLRLVGPEEAQHWANRAHFFAAAAEAMRRILVEEARRKQSHEAREACSTGAMSTRQSSPRHAEVDVLELDEALDRLAERDPEAAQLVNLRFFAGMTHPEAARRP